MTKKELLHHNSFLLYQIKLAQKGTIKLFYRGDSISNLCNRLNIDLKKNSTNLQELLNRLFLIGDKAQRFLVLDENFEITNIDAYVFEKIFKYIEDSLKNKNVNSINFFNRNPILKNFFSVKLNKRKFIEIIDSATENEKFQIRNYYLVLLHQLSAINYKKKSHFVSTSSDYGIAEYFAGQDRNKRIILHCWQPIKYERQIIKKYHLPNYYNSPYDYQKEVSILGGILPHFISGIEISLTNKFYPNPHIFRNDISKETFLNGLEIDQSNFNDILTKTNYKRGIITDGKTLWEYW